MKYFEILVFDSHGIGGGAGNVQGNWPWVDSCWKWNEKALRLDHIVPKFNKDAWPHHQSPFASHKLRFLLGNTLLSSAWVFIDLPAANVNAQVQPLQDFSASICLLPALYTRVPWTDNFQGSRCFLFIIYLNFTTVGGRIYFPLHPQFCWMRKLAQGN